MKQLQKLSFLAVFAAAGAATSADVVFSDAKWKDAVDGSFSETDRWDQGRVPSRAEGTVVNGFLFNKAEYYTVGVDKPATLNFLYIGADFGDESAGKVTLAVTNDLLMSSVPVGWTGYDPASGSEKTMSRRSLELKGPLAEMVVKDGAVLTVRPEIPDNTWVHSTIGRISDGARLYVTNAALKLDTLHNATYGDAHLHFDSVGTIGYTSVVEVVDGSVSYNGADDGASYGNPWKFREYSRGIFTDTVLDMGAAWDLSPSSVDKPVPEIVLDGSSVYRWNRGGNGAVFNGGHVVFGGNACYTNNGTANAKHYIGPSLDNTSMHVELLGNSTFAGYGTVKNDLLRLGQGSSGARNTTTRLTVDTTGEFRIWTGLQIGCRWGVGHFELKRGTVKIGGWGDILLGDTFTDNRDANDNQCVTGRLDIAGGVLTADNSAPARVRGLVVGGAYNPREAGATDYYSYGEVNMTGGCVSNRSDVWVGTGFAKGVFRQSGGAFISDNHVVLGAGGGDGEMHILGGTYTIQDAWAHPGTATGHGSVYIGGASRDRLSVMGRIEKMPANFPYDRLGRGYLCVSNASFFVGSYGVNIGTDIGSCGTGLLELKEGATYSTAYLAMTNGAGSRLRFTLAGETAPLLTVREQFTVGPGAKLTVDVRGYTGKKRYVQLVEFARGNYPNQYYQGWGFFRNGKPGDWNESAEVCDSFDEDCIEIYGDAEVLQIRDNPDGTGLAAGIWVRVKSGFSVIVR